MTTDPSRVGGVVVAAGRGERLGDGGPKALISVGGRALVLHAVDTLRLAGLETVVVVHPPDAESTFRATLQGHDVLLVPGGATRTDSVRAGIEALEADREVVAVHDAARPLVPPEVVVRAVQAVVDGVLAVAPAVRVADTLKRVDGDLVVATVDRGALRGVQTPQVFPRWVLDAVLVRAGSATDELSLVERAIADGRLDGKVKVVDGSAFGMKVTYPDDLTMLEALARSRDGQEPM